MTLKRSRNFNMLFQLVLTKLFFLVFTESWSRDQVMQRAYLCTVPSLKSGFAYTPQISLLYVRIGYFTRKTKLAKIRVSSQTDTA